MSQSDTDTLDVLRTAPEITVRTHQHPDQAVPIWVRDRNGNPVDQRTATIEQLIESGTCFAGTPDDVYNQIKALNDSVGGFGNLLMFGQGGFLDHAETVANITLFAKEVLPRLCELNPTPARAEAAAQ